VSPLFEALSDCSALHDSLLPSGETSSFPFFPGDDDDEEYEDEDEEMDGEANGEGGEAGRVRSDFHSGGGPGARFRPY
jgi:nucleotide-sensitive chloride channel 1A